MLSICLFFGEFELRYAYKLYAYKKNNQYQAPKYGVTDTDRLPHRLPALKSRRTIFRFNVKLQNRLSRSVRLPKNRFRLPENRFRVASQTDYFKIGYLNRFGYLKKSVRLPKNRFGYLKIGFGYLKIDYKLKGKYVFLPFILQQQCFGLRYLNHQNYTDSDTDRLPTYKLTDKRVK